ncbi:putative ribonuclease H protein [Sesamum angolense]|uniref:Ribonuclease H protein n=1 Tax=Sesamum angolense TaxID=2727404 RepID=A0AAE1VXF5_9LAMI|nr:putative ribonuclease H protein [Sesamum angolense]
MCRSKKDGGMGFRKLHAFNLAMLTKQGWRILNNPDLLVSQILKARYFPNDEFLNAKKRSNISFTWRSILVARPIIERGVRWRIGDVRKVRAWKDPWIPRLHFFCLFTPQHIFMPDITVAELMNATGGDWNLNILEALFCAEDVDMIKSIPLGNYALDDSMVWHFNKNGRCSVKSAYQVALPIVARESRREVGESSAPTAGWNFIWKSRVPNKVRIFLWRLCNDALPTNCNLQRKYCDIELPCLTCGDLRETINVFLECHFARQAWALSHLPWGVISEWHNRAADWVKHVRSQLEHDDFNLFVMIHWRLWGRRNKRTMENIGFHPGECVVSTINMLRNFYNVVSTKPSLSPSADRWSVPEVETVKINLMPQFSGTEKEQV